MIEGLLQPTHLVMLLVLVLLLFGPRKLPELGQGLGKGIRGFKEALRGISENSENSSLQGDHSSERSRPMPEKEA